MAEAIFGLAGVVVGVFLTGAIEWWRNRQARKTRHRVAARLVFDELVRATSAMKLTAGESDHAGAARLARDFVNHGQVERHAWEAERRVLAETLPWETWVDVTNAYWSIGMVQSLAERDAHDTIGGLSVDELLANRAREGHADVEEVIEAVRAHAQRK